MVNQVPINNYRLIYKFYLDWSTKVSKAIDQMAQSIIDPNEAAYMAAN